MEGKKPEADYDKTTPEELVLDFLITPHTQNCSLTLHPSLNMALFVAHSISRKRILGKRRLRLLRASVLRQSVSMTTAVTPDASTQWQSRGRQGRQSICRSGQRHLLVPLICHCAFPPDKEDIGVSPELCVIHVNGIVKLLQVIHLVKVVLSPYIPSQ